MEIIERINALMERIGATVTQIERIPDGRTNETYLVTSGDKKYIARLAGKGTNSFINREDEVYNLQMGAKAGVAPVLYSYSEGDFLMEYIDALVIRSEEELFSGKTAEYVIEVLKKLHNSGVRLRNTYSMVQNIHTYKKELSDINGTYPEEFLQWEDRLYCAVVKLEERYKETATACHVDNYFGNIMVLQDHAMLIDWEYAGMCDRYCELVNFSIINDLGEEAELRFLKQFFADDPGEMDLGKYYLFKMANSFMWSYWHLIKLNQQMQVDYNGRRWRERLYIAVDCFKKYGGLLEA